MLLDLTRHEPPVPKVFRLVARHPHATAPALLRCLDNVRARPVAARHPGLPPARIVELLDDADPGVAEAAAANPSLPLAEMAGLIERAGHGLGVQD
ncbi:hypothetical protein ACWKSP_05350 [Micromonosporaceae bacterium Da 78-11]